LSYFQVIDITLPQICALPKDSGPCNGYNPRFYFNSRNLRCEQFVWGGCEGNPNTFETREHCEFTCPSKFGTYDKCAFVISTMFSNRKHYSERTTKFWTATASPTPSSFGCTTTCAAYASGIEKYVVQSTINLEMLKESTLRRPTSAPSSGQRRSCWRPHAVIEAQSRLRPVARFSATAFGTGSGAARSPHRPARLLPTGGCAVRGAALPERPSGRRLPER